MNLPYVIFDTNIWIYLLEGRDELIALKTKIAKKQVIPVLTAPKNLILYNETL